MKLYENHKREIIIKIDEIVENFLNYVKDIKTQNEFETKFEEYILYNLDVNVRQNFILELVLSKEKELIRSSRSRIQRKINLT